MPKNPYLISEAKQKFDTHVARATIIGIAPLFGFIAMRTGKSPLIWVDRVDSSGAPFAMAKLNVDNLGELGRRFEATGVNELGQVLNVRNGTMSLVGYRPLEGEEMDRFKSSLRKTVRKEWIEHVSDSKPGIFSSYAFASHKGSTARDKALMDIYDAKHASLKNDSILVRRAIGMGKKATEQYSRNLELSKRTTKKPKAPILGHHITLPEPEEPANIPAPREPLNYDMPIIDIRDAIVPNSPLAST